MQYRFSFVAERIGNLLVTGLDFVMVAILLTRFQAIGGWTLAEVVFLYGYLGRLASAWPRCSSARSMTSTSGWCTATSTGCCFVRCR